MSSQRGFTLVECAIACAMVAVLTTLAVPSFQGHRLRAARLDGVQALTRVHSEQEKYRDAHGMYASELNALRGVTVQTLQGRYLLKLERSSADRYRATALPQGIQGKDRECPTLTLEVSQGFPTYGPSAACWNH